MGSEMCIRDRYSVRVRNFDTEPKGEMDVDFNITVNNRGDSEIYNGSAPLDGTVIEVTTFTT